MNSRMSSLTLSSPRAWNGRYSRIPGDHTAFHVRFHKDQWWPVVDWVVGDEIGSCPMVECDAAYKLAHAVNSGKHLLGAPSGGSFLINEYGQILVPGPLGYHRIVTVGEWQGPLEFLNVLDGGTFDFTAVDFLQCGDPWYLPYIGIPHHLSFRNEVYFWSEDTIGGTKLLPPLQDDELIEAVRTLRPAGPVRFIVAYHGLVLTKIPVGPWRTQTWEARYVGRLNYEYWYPKGD